MAAPALEETQSQLRTHYPCGENQLGHHAQCQLLTHFYPLPPTPELSFPTPVTVSDLVFNFIFSFHIIYGVFYVFTEPSLIF